MSDKEKEVPQAGMFGITTETKATNNAPLLVATRVENDPMFPANWKFPIAHLVNVVSEKEYEKKDGNKTARLLFIFKDADGRQHTHIEWELDSNDAKFKEKKEGLDVRIAHIHNAIFTKMPATGIGTDATSWGDFFDKVAAYFNGKTTGEGDAVKKYYPTVPLYYKLTYYKTRMNFPLSPNFLERVVKDKPCKLLTINTTYDNLAPVGGAPKGNIPGIGGGNVSDDLPSFEEEYE